MIINAISFGNSPLSTVPSVTTKTRSARIVAVWVTANTTVLSNGTSLLTSFVVFAAVPDIWLVTVL
jgi:hypothetical protein